jgi:diaminohydroxyphosphoribosylaminopyrimidine deaminase/5-amino-6-(5-phosphoribosylamino)uracil reductase
LIYHCKTRAPCFGFFYLFSNLWQRGAILLADDLQYMQRALKLAGLASGQTSPNPMVGAVVVKDGLVIGEGYHHRAGTPHAEVNALRQAGVEATGSIIYVSLEPCCHFGRTPPCTEAIIKAGLKRVVIATRDPNPLVAGQGIEALQDAGLEVQVGLLEREALRLNEAFIKYITVHTPFVTLKSAASLDGKVATSSGESQWITGAEARCRVHRMRAASDAVLTGIGTVLADNPLLTARLDEPVKQPLRVIVDSKLQLPVESQLVQTARSVSTVVATVSGQGTAERRDALLEHRMEIWDLPEVGGDVDLQALMELLGRRDVLSVLLEAGPTLNAGALKAGIVDKIVLFLAPKIIGGLHAPGPVGGAGVDHLSEARPLSDLQCRTVGCDLMISGYLNLENTGI